MFSLSFLICCNSLACSLNACLSISLYSLKLCKSFSLRFNTNDNDDNNDDNDDSDDDDDDKVLVVIVI